MMSEEEAKIGRHKKDAISFNLIDETNVEKAVEEHRKRTMESDIKFVKLSVKQILEGLKRLEKRMNSLEGRLNGI